MKKLSILLSSLLILLSCEKEKDVYLKDYLSDNGVTFTIKGTFGDKYIESEFTMPLYENYHQSNISEVKNDYSHDVNIYRYTEDRQGRLSFDLNIDKKSEQVVGVCDFWLNVILEENKIIYISDNQSTPDLEIENVRFNSDNGNLIFEFYSQHIGDDFSYEIFGDADLVLYEY